MSATTSVDKIILTALKANVKAAESVNFRDKAKSQTEKAAAAVEEAVARNAFLRVTEYLLNRARMAQIGQPISAPFQDIVALGSTGFIKSAEFVWAEVGDEMYQHSVEELILNAPSIRILDVTAKKNRELTLRAIAIFHENPSAADKSAALDWLNPLRRNVNLIKKIRCQTRPIK